MVFSNELLDSRTLAKNPIHSNVKGWDDNGNFWANETEKRDNETLAETQSWKKSRANYDTSSDSGGESSREWVHIVSSYQRRPDIETLQTDWDAWNILLQIHETCKTHTSNLWSRKLSSGGHTWNPSWRILRKRDTYDRVTLMKHYFKPVQFQRQ